MTLQSSKNNNLAPHGSRCAGFSFAAGVFRGLFAACPICHFNAPVRRFNSGRHPLYCRCSACAVRLVCTPMWWRYPLPRGLLLALPSCRRPCVPVALSLAAP
nr:MAG TPA: zinc finger domain protein [Bacteriophage sp.]